MIQGTEHAFCVTDLAVRLRRHFRNDPTRAVYSDVKIKWGSPGLKEPAPDIAVIPDIRDRDRPRQAFHVPVDGTGPSLVIEVVSPYQDGDETDKVEIYRRAGVAEYLIVKTFEPLRVVNYSIQGYRLVEGGYRPLRPDARGRLRSFTTGLDFATAPGHRGVVIVDAATGEPLLDAHALEQRWRREAEQRKQAEQAQKQAEQVRKQAEQRQNQADVRAEGLPGACGSSVSTPTRARTAAPTSRQVEVADGACARDTALRPCTDSASVVSVQRKPTARARNSWIVGLRYR
ncbi:Uma2 family endonuclease [uncultured Thiohalocapsa sp.]|uniref:Uma2 family endonuclease n=1 Tax=uncultured Thiohalocapsa sp. TaxID=768990 RepID=UPI0025CFDC65|nr:Uma2 family endonuclease [uncultured Thiohalocapsa sp.]